MHRPHIKEEIEQDAKKISTFAHTTISFLKNKHMALVMLSIIFVSVFIYGVVRPAILGYSIYNQASESEYEIDSYLYNIDELKTELKIANSNLTSCNSFNEKLFNQFDKHYTELLDCQSELNSEMEKYTNFKEDYNEEIDNKNDEISELKSKLETIENKYKDTITNAANNICCKAKVDNPEINSYSIEDNRIKCKADGETELSC